MPSGATPVSGPPAMITRQQQQRRDHPHGIACSLRAWLTLPRGPSAVREALAVLHLEEQDCTCKHQGDAICYDDRHLTPPNAICQPKGKSGHENQEHLQRDVLGRSSPPYSDHLRNIRGCRAECSSVTGIVE